MFVLTLYVRYFSNIWVHTDWQTDREKVSFYNIDENFPLPTQLHKNSKYLRKNLKKGRSGGSLSRKTPDGRDSCFWFHNLCVNQPRRPTSGIPVLNPLIQLESPLRRKPTPSRNGATSCLLNNHLRLIIDQEYVAFVYYPKQNGKVKNEKTQRWKIVLWCFSYDVLYRPRPENTGLHSIYLQCCTRYL